MKRLLPIFLCLLLLCGCAQPEPGEATQTSFPNQTVATEPGDAEGIKDPDTEIVYLLVKKLITNDQGQELWHLEYTYDNTGFCTSEQKFSNIDMDSYTRINSPDPLGRIASSVITTVGGDKRTIACTYDDQGWLLREETLYEDGTREVNVYSYNDRGNRLSHKQYFGDDLVMDYSCSYTYDGNGQLISLDEYEFGELSFHIVFSYDDQGRETGTVTSQLDGTVHSRTESQWDGLTETRYFFSGQETEAFMVSVFTYDDQGNVVFEETRQGEMVLNRAEYIYEPFEVKK